MGCRAGEEFQRGCLLCRCTPALLEIESMVLERWLLCWYMCYRYQGSFIYPEVAWVELICCSKVDPPPLGSLALMWAAVRAVGLSGSNLMRRVCLSNGARRGYSVSPITSLIRESPAGHKRMTMFWASPRHTPVLSVDSIRPTVIGICWLRLSLLLGLGPEVLPSQIGRRSKVVNKHPLRCD